MPWVFNIFTGKFDWAALSKTDADDLTDGGETALHIHDARYYTETELSSTSPGGGSGGDLIGVPVIAGSTYSTLHDLADAFSSAGRHTGGAISDAGSETVNVTAGTGWIKATDDDTAELLAFDWAASNGVSIPTDTTRFIGVVYGTPPVVDVRAADTYDLDTEFSLGSVVNEGGTLHILNNPWWVTDGITNILERFRAEGHFVRDNHIGGLVLSVTATRRIVVSGGTLWSLVNEFEFSNFTSVADAATFEAYYVDALGVWRDADLYQYLVTSWNDKSITGTGALAVLGNNKYLNLWVYIEADDDEVAIVYGDTQYVSAAGAEAQSPPESLPNHIVEHGILIGRILIKQGVDTPVEVQTAWVTQFTASLATIHSNLANLAWSVSGHTIDGDIAMGTNKLTGLKVPNTAGDSIRATAKITEALLESATDHLTGTEHAELNAWLDDVVLADGGAITTTQVATFAQLVLTPRADALSAVQGGIFFDSDDNSVYVCTEGA